MVTGAFAQGWPAGAPYDVIFLNGAAERVPDRLLAQLAEGGRLVGPVNTADQRLVLLRRSPEGLIRSEHERVRFVPLISELG